MWFRARVECRLPAATSAAIRSALDYYAGTVALTGGGSVVVAHIEYKNESDGFFLNLKHKNDFDIFTKKNGLNCKDWKWGRPGSAVNFYLVDFKDL